MQALGFGIEGLGLKARSQGQGMIHEASKFRVSSRVSKT